MPEIIKKLSLTQFLRSKPQFSPLTFIDPGDGNDPLQVIAGEKVKTGNKPDVDEATGGRTFKWVFVEAIAGNNPDKRKGFVSDAFLVAETTDVPTPGVFEPFPASVEKADFADACVMQAELNAVNPAYLYALAFVQSGTQWSDTEVKTSDPSGAATMGVYQFTPQVWQDLLKLAELDDLTAEQIKSPTAECVVAAVLTSKSASALGGLIPDHGLSAVDLYLTFMFTVFGGDTSFGSIAAAKILDAEKTAPDRPSVEVIRQIYQDDTKRKAFLTRNNAIFKDDGSATIAEALKACSDKFAAAFAEVSKLAREIQDSLPSDPQSPLQSDNGALGDNIQAKPGPNKAIIDKLIAGAKAQGLDPMMVCVFVDIESEFDPTNCSRLSSAAGLFQFTDSTWAAAGGPSFPGRGGTGKGHAAGASVDLQIKIGCTFTAENLHTLTANLGQTPTPVQLYMVHQQGMAGGLAILKAPPDKAIEDVIGVDAARNNGFAGLTVAQTINKFKDLYQKREREVAEQVTVTPKVDGSGIVRAGSVLGKAVQFSLSEMQNFAQKNGATVVETQQPLRSRVLQYFAFVGENVTDPSAEPWSAAFISFVMNGAGATSFPFSPAHSHYTLIGLANRIANRLNAPVVYFDKNEMAPRVGDLIGFSNTSDVKNRSDLERFLPDKFYASHTNLVVEVSPGKIKAIGGNVSQTIKITNVKTTADGKIDPANKHFFVLRLNM